MDNKTYHTFLSILKQELIPALGCTEPIAVALAAAKARDVLGEFPGSLEIRCSGNIVKNVKGVTVPNSGGMKGIGAAAVLGVVGGKADASLEVLSGITEEQRERTRKLLGSEFFSCKLEKNVDNLYVAATVRSKEHSATVTILNRHTLISKIVRDGETLFEIKALLDSPKSVDKSLLNVKSIIEFAETVKLEEIDEPIGNQIRMNTRISEYGLTNDFGTRVGHTLLKTQGSDTRTRAKARAAAGSDARMSGCALPVVINSGSGNQGLTVSLPVIEYAEHLKAGDEKLRRALVISNLIAIHQKKYIGSLSAFCGAVTAACGAGAAITYLCGGDYEKICNTITNTIANVGGVICDGAKPSCAAKIASSVDAAIMAHEMSMSGHVFHSGEGIVQQNIESTIKSVGYVGRVGMKETDVEILRIMTNEVKFS